jgi:hypothetical protein
VLNQQLQADSFVLPSCKWFWHTRLEKLRITIDFSDIITTALFGFLLAYDAGTRRKAQAKAGGQTSHIDITWFDTTVVELH